METNEDMQEEIVAKPVRRSASPKKVRAQDAVVLRVTRRSLVWTVSIVVIAAAVAALAYGFHWGGLGLSAQQKAAAQVSDITRDVGKLMILPTGENPQVATITNAAALPPGQLFYQGAQNGDKVLIYTAARKAIIYRPSSNQIVNVGPVSFAPAATTTPSVAATSTASVMKKAATTTSSTKKK